MPAQIPGNKRHPLRKNFMEKLSRTKKKLHAEKLQKLGESLVELPEIEINKMDISQELKQAALDAQKMTQHGAKRRQLQYIGSLMRNLDPTTIEGAVEHISRGRAVAEQKFKAMEKWRDDLINDANSGSTSVIESFLDQYPGADRQRLGQLVRNAGKDSKKLQESSSTDTAAKMPKSSRTLFRYIREIVASVPNL